MSGTHFSHTHTHTAGWCTNRSSEPGDPAQKEGDPYLHHPAKPELWVPGTTCPRGGCMSHCQICHAPRVSGMFVGLLKSPKGNLECIWQLVPSAPPPHRKWGDEHPVPHLHTASEVINIQCPTSTPQVRMEQSSALLHTDGANSHPLKVGATNILSGHNVVINILSSCVQL